MSWIGQSDAIQVAKTPSDQHVIWNRVTAFAVGARRGPRRTIAMAYPAASSPTINQTSGWGVHFGKSTANGMGPSSDLQECVEGQQHDEVEADRGDGADEEEAPEHRLVGAEMHVPRRHQ